MSAAILLADARFICRGFGSVPVCVAGNATAPDGRPLRGMYDMPQRMVDDGNGQIREVAETLRIPAADVPTVTRGSTITVNGNDRIVREKIVTGDGYVVVLELART